MEDDDDLDNIIIKVPEYQGYYNGRFELSGYLFNDSLKFLITGLFNQKLPFWSLFNFSF